MCGVGVELMFKIGIGGVLCIVVYIGFGFLVMVVFLDEWMFCWCLIFDFLDWVFGLVVLGLGGDMMGSDGIVVSLCGLVGIVGIGVVLYLLLFLLKKVLENLMC